MICWFLYYHLLVISSFSIFLHCFFLSVRCLLCLQTDTLQTFCLKTKNHLKSSLGIISVNMPVSSCSGIYTLSENLMTRTAGCNYQVEGEHIWPEERLGRKEITLLIIIFSLIHSTVNAWRTYRVPSILLSNMR